MARVSSAAGAALVVLVGCSSSSSSSGGAATASAFAQQFCALLEPCCADAGLGGAGGCTSLLSSTMDTYNPSSGQACLDAARQAAKETNFCAGSPLTAPACNSVFSSAGTTAGSVAPGKACMDDSDCTPASGGGAVCLTQFDSDGGTSKVCVQTKTGSAGQGPCVGTVSSNGTTYSWSGTGSLPSLGYVCDNSGNLACDFSTQKCVVLATTGQPCTSASTCVASDFCDSSSGSNLCAARLKNGASCAGLLLDACLSTSYCDGTTQLCTAGLPAGSACTSGQSCQSRACVNQKCSSTSNLVLSLLCGP